VGFGVCVFFLGFCVAVGGFVVFFFVFFFVCLGWLGFWFCIPQPQTHFFFFMLLEVDAGEGEGLERQR